ncbi:nuclear envelope phosphatase-regulatory subunit 1-like isoform X2 [Dendronephthya gigantea]|uniref:nuclear envelope phosphatase-regulatory subunit 1-like isoform X2 n=1 Tax=Dendronephthya gigantea TaxID=151771 RepID=UPI00106D03CE|nr:nuclear envelope phosphatase-regulatory subunit 1-like isoform X2 [Dendronephthya gigantea]
MSSQRDQVEVTEDLKAFERRLTEYISGLHPKAVRWRIVFAMSSICTIFSTWFWITDETMANRVREPQTILKRCRLVLDDYNMSCDDRGKLILKPRTSLQDKYPSHAR